MPHCGAGGSLRFPMTTPASAEHALIKTTYGDMTIAFWPDVAPKTVENFKKLASEKFYDGTAFHRVIKGFMIQGGCPNGHTGQFHRRHQDRRQKYHGGYPAAVFRAGAGQSRQNQAAQEFGYVERG